MSPSSRPPQARVPRATPPHGLTVDLVARDIVDCEACPRLRRYCAEIAQTKRRAYLADTYWGRPVPGFGDPSARIVLVGLAPAAHGANRTGRVFTGDGVGGSGDFLMTALHSQGLANQPFSRTRDDGLVLRDVWIMAAVRCAPPDNAPTPIEIRRCHRHLVAELDALRRVQVLVALGRIAFEACWNVVRERANPDTPMPRFAHGLTCDVGGAPTIVASYHPSRQNTQTGRLTPQMLSAVMGTARERAGVRS